MLESDDTEGADEDVPATTLIVGVNVFVWIGVVDPPTVDFVVAE